MAHKDRWNTNTLIEILRGAADLVGRSPYPLVEAAERFGFDCDSRAFEQAKIYRDRMAQTLRADKWDYHGIAVGFELQPAVQSAHRSILLEAAGMLQTGQWP